MTRGGHILYEQEYNARHGIQVIPNVWGQLGQPEVQQELVAHLFLEKPLGWDSATPDLPVSTAAQTSQPVHSRGTEVDPAYVLQS